MTILGVDVWEGDPTLDEAVLHAAGVEFMIVRLNDMNGGHHVDQNFAAQWAQAEPFLRWPYFVYNPWASGQENFTWLANHMPADATAIAIDIEVVKPGYAASEYARQVAEFLHLIGNQWRVMIYTGAWFITYLSTWPTGEEYWWARYPYSVYPPEKTYITWEQLHAKLLALGWAPGYPPGACHLWQCTADRYILPGCDGDPVDINLYNGTVDELREMIGAALPEPTPIQQLFAWAHTQGYTGPDPEAGE